MNRARIQDLADAIAAFEYTAAALLAAVAAARLLGLADVSLVDVWNSIKGYKETVKEEEPEWSPKPDATALDRVPLSTLTVLAKHGGTETEKAACDIIMTRVLCDGTTLRLMICDILSMDNHRVEHALTALHVPVTYLKQSFVVPSTEPAQVHTGLALAFARPVLRFMSSFARAPPSQADLAAFSNFCLAATLFCPMLVCLCVSERGQPAALLRKAARMVTNFRNNYRHSMFGQARGARTQLSRSLAKIEAACELFAPLDGPQRRAALQDLVRGTGNLDCFM